MANTCGTCAHFNARTDVSRDLGECRRYPPTAFQEITQGLDNKPRMVIAAYYASVHRTLQWCGEWSPRLMAANDQ